MEHVSSTAGRLCVAVVTLALTLLIEGRAQAQVAVSDGGAPTFGYPIAVPPGVGGVTPKLTLQYVGGGINGPLGLGWSLQGLSSITRCPSTRAIDGVGTSVTYGPADKLCLDGQRLIQSDAAGVPLASQIDDGRGVASGAREFRTEKDVYARVRAYGVANGSDVNGPAYFKVWIKSGLIYEYGAPPTADANSKGLVAAYGKNAVMVWAVTRISDTAGNYMDFKYEQRDVAWGSGPTGPSLGREWNIAEVQYTGRAGQSSANKVVFSYTDRVDDRSEAYHEGSKNISVRLLDRIRTYVNSPNPTALGPAANAVMVKVLKLGYQLGPRTRRNLVTSVKECADAAEQKCMPATSFTYAAGQDQSYQVNAGFRNSGMATLPMHSTSANLGILLGDFNGDGRTDIIRWSDAPSGNEHWLSNGDGTFTQVPNGSGAAQFNITDQNLFKSDGCYSSAVIDMNADGVPDILRYNAASNPAGVTCASLGVNYIYFARGDGSFNRVQFTSAALSKVQSVKTRRCGTANCLIEPLWLIRWTAGSTFYLLDVNSDGRPDIVTTTLPAQADYDETSGPPADACASTTCTRVFRNNGDGTFTEIPTNVANRSLYSRPAVGYEITRYTKTVDVNGDGLLDLVGMERRYSNSAYGWRSRGDGNFDAFNASNAECISPLDFNGDQRADCLGSTVYYSDGTLVLQQTATFNLGGPGQEVFSTAIPSPLGTVTGDFNGDGRHDILRWKDDPAQNAIYLSNGDGSFAPASASFNLTTADWALQHSNGSYGFVVADFTGRGMLEILRLRDAPAATSDATKNLLFEKAIDPLPQDQLLTVRSPTQALTSLSYVSLAAPTGGLGARYTSDRDAANTSIYPRLHLTVPLHVVSTLYTDNGLGGLVTTEYSYKGLKADWNGRGLLGFSEIRRESQGPDGNYLTNFTQYLQAHPYIGVASRTDTRRGRWNAPAAPLISSITNIYCDKTAVAGAEASATVSQPCPTSAKIQRPYLSQSVETGTDLGGAPLPTVTTTNAFNAGGDPTSIVVTTAGTVAGLSETYTKTTTNTYLPDNTAADNWILGRLQRASVRSVTPNNFANLAVSAGSAPNATATAGTKEVLAPISPVSISQSRATAGALSAMATVSVGGFPTPPLTYAWTRVAGATTLVTATPASGSTNNTTFGATLALGQSINETYRVTVTDAVGRVGTDQVVVSFSASASPMNIAVTPAEPAAYRSDAGALSVPATVTRTGGVAPFIYSWTRLTGSRITLANGTTATATFNATLNSGETVSENFQVSVTDAGGQVKLAGVTVTFTSGAAPALSITGFTPTAAIGTRNNPGSAAVTAAPVVQGGAPPLTYLWTRVTGSRIALSNATSQTATFTATLGWNENFGEGFQVRVQDAAGQVQTATTTVTFTTPAAPTVAISPASLTMSSGVVGAMSDTATASGAGGVPGYTYAWSRLSGSRIAFSGAQTVTFSTSVDYADNFTETFQVTMTDSVGNTITQAINVTAIGPALPALTISVPSSVVGAVGSGTATANATATITSGGAGGIVFSWVQLSGDAMTLNGANSQTASFSGNPERPQTQCDAPVPLGATFRVTVSDRFGQVATGDVYVELYANEPIRYVPDCALRVRPPTK